MSTKLRSLGTVSAAARGIVVTSGTNATPIVATITAGHRLKDGDRIGIVGVTGLTAMNGDWTVKRVTDTTYQLLGSKGNGAYGGTAVAAALMDLTPHQEKHAALCLIGQPSGAVLVGTLVIEGATQRKSDNTEFGYTDSSGNYASGFTSALMSGEVAIPAATAGQVIALEVSLMRYMTLRASAYTSGVAGAWLAA
jgi:hypothetical protein